MAHLGELLAELRQDSGMTQKELGQILCVSSGTISNYENNVHLPDAEKIITIADYFHITTDYLLGRTSSSISSDALQCMVTENKTISDVLNTFIKLPRDRQQALALIMSDMEINLMIDEYSKRGGR